VTVSFFEWVQNLQNFRWEEDEVNKRLDRAMTEAFAQIWEISRQKKLPLRTAAFVKALQSVTRAHLHSAPLFCTPSLAPLISVYHLTGPAFCSSMHDRKGIPWHSLGILWRFLAQGTFHKIGNGIGPAFDVLPAGGFD